MKKTKQTKQTQTKQYVFVENELQKAQTFDLSYFRGKSHFQEDGKQSDLIFQPMYRYLNKKQ